jgi:hypothetical protein
MVAAETRTQSGSGLDDPRGDVDGQVTGCSCRPLVLAAVDGGPDGEVESCRRDESQGTHAGRRRTVEQRQHAVARGVDLAAAAALDLDPVSRVELNRDNRLTCTRQRRGCPG